MDISVIIPAKDAGGYLLAALDSVLGQSLQPSEVIVVDDGSSDDTAAIARRHPLHPHVLTGFGAGAAAARNFGVATAHGPWLAFLDADDLWHQDHLATAIRCALEHDAVAVSARWVSFASDLAQAAARAPWVDIEADVEDLSRRLRAPLPASQPPRLVRPVDIATGVELGTPSAVVVRRDIFQAAGGFPTLFTRGEDIACWYQVSRLGRVVLSGIPTILYRTHGDALSGAADSSASEVQALAAYTAMWYGNELRPHGADASPLQQHGATNATHKLRHLMSEARHGDEAWRLSVAQGFGGLLVTDEATRRRLKRLRVKRRLEVTAPWLVEAMRRLFRG